MENSRQQYQRRMENQLREWSSRMDEVKAIIGKAGAQTKETLGRELVELEKLEAAGKKHLEEVKSLALSAWEKGKDELHDKWNMVGGSFDAIWARIQTKAA